ncbi:MAG: galactose oxidase, partial [Chloroflexi bacterium]|nr:galactose oxidase [Chloroflexota bacterium]
MSATSRHLPRRELLLAGLGAALVWSAAPVRAAQTAATALGAWTERALMPLGRSEVGVAELDGMVYVVGGYARGNVDQPLNQVYDPVADAWQTRAPLPRGVNHVAVVGSDQRLFAFGGFQEQNQSAVADVVVYDPAADTWSSLRPLPSALGAMAVCELAGQLHLVGGRNVTSVTTHRRYDPAADQWSDAAPMLTARDHL